MLALKLDVIKLLGSNDNGTRLDSFTGLHGGGWQARRLLSILLRVRILILFLLNFFCSVWDRVLFLGDGLL